MEKETSYIKLQQFLKMHDFISTGGQAKSYLQDNQVKVNGEIETRRGRKLYPGDIVETDEKKMVVQ